MSEDDGYFEFEEVEDLTFLLYVLFYDDLQEEFGDSEDLSSDHDAILQKIEKDPKKSQFLSKTTESLSSGILKPKSARSKTPNLKKVSINVLLFAAWCNHSKVVPSSIFSRSIDHLIRTSSFKKNLLTKEQFESLLKKEPLWSLCKAILYISGYQSLKDNKHDHECVQSDEKLKEIYDYALDSKKIMELDLIGESYNPHNYLVKPKEFVKWAQSRSIESLFIYEEVKVESKKSTKESSSYITPDMQLMFDAVNHFWKDYDLQKPNIHIAPTKADVVDWLLKEAGKRKMDFSKTRAEHIDTIIRCPKSRRGGNTF